jgi:hypothetical protein
MARALSGFLSTSSENTTSLCFSFRILMFFGMRLNESVIIWLVEIMRAKNMVGFFVCLRIEQSFICYNLFFD